MTISQYIPNTFPHTNIALVGAGFVAAYIVPTYFLIGIAIGIIIGIGLCINMGSKVISIFFPGYLSNLLKSNDTTLPKFDQLFVERLSEMVRKNNDQNPSMISKLNNLFGERFRSEMDKEDNHSDIPPEKDTPRSIAIGTTAICNEVVDTSATKDSDPCQKRSEPVPSEHHFYDASNPIPLKRVCHICKNPLFADHGETNYHQVCMNEELSRDVTKSKEKECCVVCLEPFQEGKGMFINDKLYHVDCYGKKEADHGSNLDCVKCGKYVHQAVSTSDGKRYHQSCLPIKDKSKYDDTKSFCYECSEYVLPEYRSYNNIGYMLHNFCNPDYHSNKRLKTCCFCTKKSLMYANENVCLACFRKYTNEDIEIQISSRCCKLCGEYVYPSQQVDDKKIQHLECYNKKIKAIKADVVPCC